MKKTPKKILTNARLLFNTEGVSNVRLQDIAKKSSISPGNLSYHYAMKKDLMKAVLDLFFEATHALRAENLAYLEQEDYISVIKNYLRFQIGHRFFYRDILDIKKLVPDSKNMYKTQMNQVINFTKNGMYLAIEKGLIKAESHEGEYDFFAKNVWAILNSWLLEREVLGEKKVSMQQVIQAIWEFHFPYLTKEGRALLIDLKTQLPQLVEI